MLDGADSRKMADVKSEDGKKDRYYLFYDGETVAGKVGKSSWWGGVWARVCLELQREL